MKYKKNKLKLNEIASMIQGFYFLIKFGLVLIYILKACHKKSSSILLRQNMFNPITCIFLLKSMYLLSRKSRDYSLQVSREIFFWDLFSLTDTNNSQDSREGRVNHYFSCFWLLLTQEHGNFYFFFSIDLFVITELIADETCSP